LTVTQEAPISPARARPVWSPLRVLRRGSGAGIAAATTLSLAAITPAGAEPAAQGGGNRCRGDHYSSTGADAQGGHASHQSIRDIIERMTLEQKVGQLFVSTVYGPRADTVNQSNVTAYGPGLDTPAKVIARYHLGGVIYFPFTESLQNPPQIAELSNGLQQASLDSGAGLPLLITIDQEQGPVNRIGAPTASFPGAMALGSGYVARTEAGLPTATADTREAAAIVGAELRAMGINVDYAPVADVNVNPANPVIGVRSFSSDPTIASTLVTAAAQGFQCSGPRSEVVSATAKHFPGHGDTAIDSHTGLPSIDHTRAQWEAIDAPPFRAAVEAGVDAIMTAHIQVPSLDPSGDPATLSKPIVTGLLREELHFDGVVITDALDMQGVRDKYGDDRVPVLALKAGVDLLLMPPDFPLAYDNVLSAVRSGEISERRIDESLTRILKMKANRGLFEDPLVDVSKVGNAIGTPEHLAAAQAISDRAITVVQNDAGVLPLAPAPANVLVTGWGDNAINTLAGAITARGSTATAMPTGAQPTPAAVAAVVAAAQSTDVVVVLTNRTAALATEPNTDTAQRELIAQLVPTGVPVVAVAARNPYDAVYFAGPSMAGSAPPTWVATYAYTPPLLESLTRVLYGEIAPLGRLPVEMPSPDGAGPSYSFGHGVTWEV
jgi:beta-N-acetylhexosaminidase